VIQFTHLFIIINGEFEYKIIMIYSKKIYVQFTHVLYKYMYH